jgi:hypothetical protein
LSEGEGRSTQREKKTVDKHGCGEKSRQGLVRSTKSRPGQWL